MTVHSFEPLGFVLGSSIYHIGVQPGRWTQNMELAILSAAQVVRLQRECRLS